MVIQYAGCANDASVEDVLRRGNCEQHILEVHLYPDEVKFAIIHGTAPIADDGNHQAQVLIVFFYLPIINFGLF